LGVKNNIIKKNVLTCVSYMAIIFLLSLLFSKQDRSLIFPFLFSIIAGFHFMVVGVLMAINHFNLKSEKRNAYMISFGVIWLLIVISQTIFFL